MKKTIIKKEMWLALSFLGLGFAACDENIHDFSKVTASEPSNYVYIAEEEEEFVYNVLQNLDGGHSAADTILIKFPVHLTKAAQSEMKMTLDVDNDLIAVYNAAHGTSYLPLDAQYRSLKNDGKLTIPKGETRSKDSLTLVVTRAMKDLTNLNGYLIPVKIRNFDGIDVGIDYQRRHSYLAINVAFENTVQASGMTIVNTAYQALNEVAFTVHSLYPIRGAGDAKVQMSVNNDRIAEFNTRMGSHFQPVTSGLPSSYEVGISTGSSDGTFTLNYSGDLSALNDPRGYVVPLEVTSVTGENMTAPESNKNVIYAVIYSNKGGFVADEANLVGTKVTDRSGYNVVKFAYNNGAAPSMTGTPNNLFSSTMVGVMPLSRPLCITVDLGKEIENIKGFQIVNSMANGSNFNIRTLDVAYATQAMYEGGISMELGKGINLLTADPSLPKNCNIGFDKPITARYLYIDNIQHNGGTYLGLTDFYIFTQSTEN
jgi:hypothetical protein